MNKNESMDMGTRIVFTGDICFDKYFSNGWREQGCLSNEVEAYLDSGDFVVANIEGPLTKRDFNRSNTQVHSSDPGVGNFLYAHNMRIWNLGNNHMMDCSWEGLFDTFRCAKNENCVTIGAGETLSDAEKGIIIGNNVKVGVLSIAKPWSYIISDVNKAGVFTWDRIPNVKRRIQELKQSARWVVLVVHGGDEFSDLSTPDIRKTYRSLIDIGADVIVGHHPHVVQQIEKVGNKLIFYSLGNFIFDTDYQRNFKYTDTGILLGIDFGSESFSYNHMPIWINRETQIVEKASVTPAIFCVIENREYQLLWPLAARRLYQINEKKWCLTQHRFKQTNNSLSIIHMLYGLRQKNNRTIAKGKVISNLHKWKASELSEVCEYLMQN